MSFRCPITADTDSKSTQHRDMPNHRNSRTIITMTSTEISLWFQGTVRRLSPKHKERVKGPKIEPKEIDDGEQLEDQATRHRWLKGVKAYSEGWKMPETRYPVVIQSDTWLTSAEKLKGLIDLTSTPKTCITKTTSLFPPDTSGGKEVSICDVNWEQLNLIEEKTKAKQELVWFNNQKRFALVILSLQADTRTGEKVEHNEKQVEQVPAEVNPVGAAPLMTNVD